MTPFAASALVSSFNLLEIAIAIGRSVKQTGSRTKTPASMHSDSLFITYIYSYALQLLAPVLLSPHHIHHILEQAATLVQLEQPLLAPYARNHALRQLDGAQIAWTGRRGRVLGSHHDRR